MRTPEDLRKSVDDALFDRRKPVAAGDADKLLYELCHEARERLDEVRAIMALARSVCREHGLKELELGKAFSTVMDGVGAWNCMLIMLPRLREKRSAEEGQ